MPVTQGYLANGPPYACRAGVGHKPFACFHVRALVEPDQDTSSVGAKTLKWGATMLPRNRS